jgi:heme/copper-type cytochrome/quinol oxidase subunit 4
MSLPVEAKTKQSGRALAGAFAALCVLTVAELLVVGSGSGSGAGRSVRVVALVGLLITKAGVVLSFFLRASARPRAAALTLAAIVMAVGFAVVLLLEAGFLARAAAGGAP